MPPLDRLHFCPHSLETWMWATMENKKQRPMLLQATSETKGMHKAETLTLTGSLDLHAAVGHFLTDSTVHDLCPAKKNPGVPKLPLLVLLRGETRQHHTPHTTHNLKYRQRILCRLLSRLAKNIECSSLADWLTDPIAKTCIKNVWL